MKKMSHGKVKTERRRMKIMNISGKTSKRKKQRGRGGKL